MDKEEKAGRIPVPVDEALDWMDQMEQVPDVLDAYELTEDDLNCMETDPKKYLPFAVYLANVQRDPPEGRERKRAREQTEYFANLFIEEHLELVDSEE